MELVREEHERRSWVCLYILLIMELDERLRWIEIRVTSSLKPRAEELKHLFTTEECRSDKRFFIELRINMIVLLLNSPNSSPYFSLNKFEGILLN